MDHMDLRGRASGRAPSRKATTKMIDTSGLDTAMVLAALVNNATPMEWGLMDPNAHRQLTVRKAAELLRRAPHGYIDYVHGRPIHLRLSGNQFDEWQYDHDNGKGLAECVGDHLRRTGSIERIV
jgi:hypothetical protein